MVDKNLILEKIRLTNDKYKSIGFKITNLFGSYARETNDDFSDIDLTYKINHNIFFKDNAFKKLAKIEEIKKELETIFHKKIDLVPENSKNKIFQKSIQEEKIAI